MTAQEVEAERYTRLVRKQEIGAGPLRYSIELRRSAGAFHADNPLVKDEESGFLRASAAIAPWRWPWSVPGGGARLCSCLPGLLSMLGPVKARDQVTRSRVMEMAAALSTQEQLWMLDVAITTVP